MMGNAISPQHYQQHPSGLECIEVVRDQTYLIGCTIKYLWRAGLKGDRLEDLQKARQYLSWADWDYGIDESAGVTEWTEWFFRTGTVQQPVDHVICAILLDRYPEALEQLDDLIKDTCDWCRRCTDTGGLPTRMYSCATCRSKRCPRAGDHRRSCTDPDDLVAGWMAGLR